MLVLLQAENGSGVGDTIVAIVIALLLCLCVFNSIYFIKEKETVVIEFLGHFSRVLPPARILRSGPFTDPNYTGMYPSAQYSRVTS